jgi:hypothetical protein
MAFKLLNRNPDPVKEQIIEEIKEEVNPTRVVRPQPVKPKEVYVVVSKLPVQEVRTVTQEDGTVVHYITIEEYLTEQANAGV